MLGCKCGWYISRQLAPPLAAAFAVADSYEQRKQMLDVPVTKLKLPTAWLKNNESLNDNNLYLTCTASNLCDKYTR